MGDEWAYRHPSGGTWVPRLTKVFDVFRNIELQRWRDRVGHAEADRVAARAAKIGGAIDQRIAKHFDGKKVVPPKAPDAARAWQAWLRWREAQGAGFAPTRQQCLLFSPLGYAGTPDCIEDGALATGGVNRVTEWKCTNAIEPIHWIQVMAQVGLAWPKLIGSVSIDDGLVRLDGPVPRVRIVRVDPFLGMVEPVERDFSPRLLLTFLAMLKVYRDLFFEPEIARQQAAAEAIEAVTDEEDLDGKPRNTTHPAY